MSRRRATPGVPQWLPVLSAVAAVVRLGLLAAGQLPLATGAQGGTPPAGQAGAPAGTSFALIAAGRAATLPPAPAVVTLARFGLEPGASFAIPADNPSAALVYVESGTLTLRLTAPVVVTRGGAVVTPGTRAQEEVPAGTAFTLGPGDSFLGPPLSGGEFCNDGTEPVAGLNAIVEPE